MIVRNGANHIQRDCSINTSKINVSSREMAMTATASNGQVAINWGSNPNASSYEVRRSDHGGIVRAQVERWNRQPSSTL